MTGPCQLTPLAQADIESIWDFTAAQWNAAQAEIYVRRLWQDIESVTANPELGRDCSEVRPGYQKYPSGSHLLYYRRTAMGVEIVRILHKGMDHPPQLDW